ncbi:hypothetical protein FHG87_007179 [Trinorchestia longiramus]|nr:hypothetical protein FHG87_007179 [Trinorchestia longiramus]
MNAPVCCGLRLLWPPSAVASVCCGLCLLWPPSAVAPVCFGLRLLWPPSTVASMSQIFSERYENRGCRESHGSTTNEYRDEANFHRPMSKQDTKVNPTKRLGLGTTRSTTLTNERSRSGSRAQSTAQYKEAATLLHLIYVHPVPNSLSQTFPIGTDRPTDWVTNSLPSASKVNISAKNSHHLKYLTHLQQQSKGSRNQPSCLRTGWGSNNPRNNKKCKFPTRHALQLYTSQRTTGKMSVRQHHNVKTCATKNQELISYSKA